MTSTPSQPRIALVATGGTIASIGHDELDLAFYGETGRTIDAQTLLDRVPPLTDIAEVVPIDFSRIGSSSITANDWLKLAATVNQLLADDAIDGVVITHGTNTMEETAYFLSLVTPQIKPTVLVGSMRPPTAYSADGDMNLLDAVRAAASEQLRHHGTMLCMGGEIFGPKYVTKGDTYRPDAFHAGLHGPVASIDPTGQVMVHCPPPTGDRDRPQFDLAGRSGLPRVAVALSYATQDATIIRALIDAGFDGIVSAAPGAGKPSPDERVALAEAVRRGIAVVQATRIPQGWVVDSDPLRDAGIVAARDLLPWKARILLSLALTVEPRPTRAQLQRLFDTA